MIQLLSFSGVLIASLTAPPEKIVDSGLWRSVFLFQPADESPSEAAAKSPQDPSNEGSDSDFATTADVREGLVPDALIPSIDPVTLADSDELIATRQLSNPADAEFQDAAHLSDWDRAVVSATGTKQKPLARNGPSVVSIVVGLVGLVVVCGAYFSGKT